MGDLTKIQKCLLAYDLRRQATFPISRELHLARQSREREESPELMTLEDVAEFNFLEERRAMLFALGESHGVLKDADLAPRIAFAAAGDKKAETKEKEREDELVLLRSNLAEAQAKAARYQGRMQKAEELLAETKSALDEKADESSQCAKLEGQLEQLAIEAAKKEEELGKCMKKVEELRGELSGYEKEKAEKARLTAELSRLHREINGLYERVGRETERGRSFEEQKKQLEREVEEMKLEREEMRKKLSAQKEALVASLAAARSSDPEQQAIQDLHTSLSHLATTIPHPVPGFLSLVLTELPNSTGRAASIHVTPSRVTVVLGGDPVDVLVAPLSETIFIVWRDMEPYVAVGPRVFLAGEPNDALTVADFGRDNGIYADDQMPQLNRLLEFLDTLYP